MLGFLLKRLATLVPTLVGITLVAFGLIRLVPGDPIEVMMGERRLDPEAHAALVKRMGLDQPLPVQYADYVGKLLHGDLGQSLVSREPVVKEFAALFPATVELACAALIFAVGFGLLLGVSAALRRGSLLDQGVMGMATVGYSMPIFWWGLILIMFFSVNLGWTPVSGRIGIEYDPERVTGFMLIDAWLSDARGAEEGAFKSALMHLILPALVLGTSTLAVVARMTRSSMLEVLREDYVRTARAKGLSPARVVIVHALRNALIPVLTVVGLQTGSLLAGAVLTETIFSWPGIGKWLIDSIARRDYPVVQAGILISALTFIGVNLIVDVLYGVVNPRIRGGGH
ncbi:ABC transporter permease [Roseateles saccharophilus]|uniref:Dipeptide transport system permease protein n=1 Tax=Roseateles saccharophilus TaxID=304 RepID=A0A4R3VMI0_ROSSA|nr:ABC transporter permease subunit [Roseateles saccharophilus]MDG0831244.1 ABC transporter permease subunit [Roseateles saccharophilus]TCV04365.1 dipeptide transport system permease protein [Roseateles saccharophilus]